MGASTGGIETFMQIVSALPRHVPAAIFVVLHVAPRGTTKFPEILTRAGHLPAAHAVDNEPIQPGRIYVAPPDFHMLLRNGSVRIVRGPKENNVRPAIDATFRTAARAYGPRVVGVVLSGALDDGTAGLAAIKERGGIAVVQDPKDAIFPDMPRNALEHVRVDYCVPAGNLAAAGAACRRTGAGRSGRAGSGTNGERGRNRGDGYGCHRRRRKAGDSVGIRLPRVRRCSLGIARRRIASLSLPGWPRIWR